MITTWTIDPNHTTVEFAAKHLMISTVRGSFRDVAGTIELDDEDITRSWVRVSVPTATIKSGVEPRDNHLKSADFLDVVTYPEMIFASTSIEPAGGHYLIRGDLTIRGVTRPVMIETDQSEVFPGMRGERRTAFEGRARINRRDWGLDWNVALETGGWLVGEQITITLDVTAIEAVPVGEEEALATGAAA